MKTKIWWVWLGILLAIGILVQANAYNVWLSPVSFLKSILFTSDGSMNPNKATIKIDGTNGTISMKALKVNWSDVVTTSYLDKKIEDLKKSIVNIRTNIESAQLPIGINKTKNGYYIVDANVFTDGCNNKFIPDKSKCILKIDDDTYIWPSTIQFDKNSDSFRKCWDLNPWLAGVYWYPGKDDYYLWLLKRYSKLLYDSKNNNYRCIGTTNISVSYDWYTLVKTNKVHGGCSVVKDINNCIPINSYVFAPLSSLKLFHRRRDAINYCRNLKVAGRNWQLIGEIDDLDWYAKNYAAALVKKLKTGGMRFGAASLWIRGDRRSSIGYLDYSVNNGVYVTRYNPEFGTPGKGYALCVSVVH